MYYDGGCPLCSREVNHYRRLDRDGRIRWVDISRDPRELEVQGVTLTEGMARLHVRERGGRLVSGARAFAAVWDELPYYRWLARLVRGAHLLKAMDYAYAHFARWRFRRRCGEAGCSPP
jgi:predicted DCC family thiol-disulfide oxidoreductase YuxK